MVLDTLNALVALVQVSIQAALAVVGAAGSSALQAQNGLDLSLAPPPASGYVCEKPVWETEPQLKKDKIYKAAMSTRCKVYPRLGGDFKKLQAFSLEQLKLRGQILAGPTDETFRQLPSLKVDYKLPLKMDKLEVTIWQEIHLATDGDQSFVSSTESSKIQGKGMAEYLKKADVLVEIRKTAQQGEDEAVVSFYSEMEKPWYAPESMLISKLKEMVPDQFAKVRDEFMQEAAQNY